LCIIKSGNTASKEHAFAVPSWGSSTASVKLQPVLLRNGCATCASAVNARKKQVPFSLWQLYARLEPLQLVCSMVFSHYTHERIEELVLHSCAGAKCSVGGKNVEKVFSHLS